MIKILIDSSSDFTPEERAMKGLAYVPLNIHFDTEEFQDGITITRDEFYDKLISSNSFPKTSQPSPEAFLAEFNKVKESGDELIVITLSSTLSGTYQSANIAKDMCEYDKIYVVDSLSATFIINIMVDHALKLINEGKSAVEIIKEIEDLRDRTTIYIGLDTLEYLYKGGRLNRATATIGEIANLKPSITVNRNGAVAMYKKSIGKNKAMATLVKAMDSHKPDTNYPIYTVYSKGTDNCAKLEDRITKAGYTVTKRGQLGCTIGAHLGPNIYGVIYISQDKQDL